MATITKVTGKTTPESVAKQQAAYLAAKPYVATTPKMPLEELKALFSADAHTVEPALSATDAIYFEVSGATALIYDDHGLTQELLDKLLNISNEVYNLTSGKIYKSSNYPIDGGSFTIGKCLEFGKAIPHITEAELLATFNI